MKNMKLKVQFYAETRYDRPIRYRVQTRSLRSSSSGGFVACAGTGKQPVEGKLALVFSKRQSTIRARFFR